VRKRKEKKFVFVSHKKINFQKQMEQLYSQQEESVEVIDISASTKKRKYDEDEEGAEHSKKPIHSNDKDLADEELIPTAIVPVKKQRYFFSLAFF